VLARQLTHLELHCHELPSFGHTIRSNRSIKLRLR
jgi:hypothetical protein